MCGFFCFFFSSRRRHTRCALVTGVQTCALPISHWTVRAMAKAVGIAASSVVKIWHDHGLAPHRWRSFKLSNDKAFAEKLHDVVGLYVSSPAQEIGRSACGERCVRYL